MVTYLVGMLLDIGSGLNLQPEGMRDETTVKELPEVISNLYASKFYWGFCWGSDYSRNGYCGVSWVWVCD